MQVPSNTNVSDEFVCSIREEEELNIVIPLLKDVEHIGSDLMTPGRKSHAIIGMRPLGDMTPGVPGEVVPEALAITKRDACKQGHRIIGMTTEGMIAVSVCIFTSLMSWLIVQKWRQL